MQHFFQVLVPTLRAWTSLLHITTPPINISVTQLNISHAVNILNAIIAGKETSLPARFGYVQLSRFFDILEDRIKRDRSNGIISSKSGRRNASLAIDIFIGAQCVQAPASRTQIWSLRRIGVRWRALASQSDLLLLIFSDMAESFVYVSLSSLYIGAYNEIGKILRK